MKSGFIGGIVGSLLVVLLGAAAFRAGTPVDARFTFQGQLRDGDALVSGNVDIRFTLWDAQDGGAEVGTPVTRTNLTVTDGRFATELDFGASAFAGDARWIQMEVRSPAGTGQYLALPRQRVNAVPYALYSLNGGLSPWNLDVATRDIGYVNGRVGIGTNAPTAALEVVSTAGGDDSVKLPSGSIGRGEMNAGALAAANYWSSQFNISTRGPLAYLTAFQTSFTLQDSGAVSLFIDCSISGEPYSIIVDGNVIRAGVYQFQMVTVDLGPGTHSLQLRSTNLAFGCCTGCSCGDYGVKSSITAIYVPQRLN